MVFADVCGATRIYNASLDNYCVFWLGAGMDSVPSISKNVVDAFGGRELGMYEFWANLRT